MGTRIIGVILILFGVIGLICSTIGFGDIGLAFAFNGITSILAGIGFLFVPRRRKKPKMEQRN